VAKRTQHPNEAWAFLNFASQEENVWTYLERAKRPTAQRKLIARQLEDYDLAPFAQGVLTAKTWYKGKNYQLVEEAFLEMVNSIRQGTAKDFSEAIKYAVNKVNLSY